MDNHGIAGQNVHDEVIRNIQNEYVTSGSFVIDVDRNQQRSTQHRSILIDIVARQRDREYTLLIEVETEESVTEKQASTKWRQYGFLCTVWYLAVPAILKAQTLILLMKHRIFNCQIITWEKLGEQYAFNQLPEL